MSKLLFVIVHKKTTFNLKVKKSAAQLHTSETRAQEEYTSSKVLSHSSRKRNRLVKNRKSRAIITSCANERAPRELKSRTERPIKAVRNACTYGMRIFSRANVCFTCSSAIMYKVQFYTFIQVNAFVKCRPASNDNDWNVIMTFFFTD